MAEDRAIRPVTESAEKKRVMELCDGAFSPPLARRDGFSVLFGKIDAYADFLAAYAEDAAGYIAMYANDRESKTAYITLLAVNPACQNRGWGGRLLDAAAALAAEKGMTRMRPEVRADNPGALQLYSRKGFRLESESEKGTVFMMKQLPQ